MTDTDWLDRIRTITNMTSELLADVTAGLEAAPVEVQVELPNADGPYIDNGGIVWVLRAVDGRWYPGALIAQDRGTFSYSREDMLRRAPQSFPFVRLEPVATTAKQVIDVIWDGRDDVIHASDQDDVRSLLFELERTFGVKR